MADSILTYPNGLDAAQRLAFCENKLKEYMDKCRRHEIEHAEALAARQTKHEKTVAQYEEAIANLKDEHAKGLAAAETKYAADVERLKREVLLPALQRDQELQAVALKAQHEAQIAKLLG